MSSEADNLETPAGLDEEIVACRALVGMSDRPPQMDSDADEVALLAQLRGGLDAQLEKEHGIVAFLRSRSTAQRLGLVVFAAVVVTLIAAAFSLRESATSGWSPRFFITLGTVAVLTVAATARLMRPLHAPPANPWTGRILLAAGVAMPFFMALMPAHPGGAAAGAGGSFAVACLKCLGIGAMLGLPVLGLALVMRRARVDGGAVAALAGVAAGLTGYLTLHLKCPIDDPAHVMGGHATLLLLLAGIAVVLHGRGRNDAA